MPYSIEFKNKTIRYRNKGYSLKEISKIFSISKSTCSEWMKDIKLNSSALKRLAKLKMLGQYKSVEINKVKRQKLFERLYREAKSDIDKIHFSKEICRIITSILFWCEGGKSYLSHVRFTNSDPKLIGTFLKMFRSGFKVNEKKLRALVHIHNYHNDYEQKAYWSKITKIPLNQFFQSYKKPNTGKRVRKNYQGCLAIYYYDALIAKRLTAMYNTFATYIGV